MFYNPKQTCYCHHIKMSVMRDVPASQVALVDDLWAMRPENPVGLRTGTIATTFLVDGLRCVTEVWSHLNIFETVRPLPIVVVCGRLAAR